MSTSVKSVLDTTDSIITQLNTTFEALERILPNKPRLVFVSGYEVWRCVEKEIHQALVLKAARMISLVNTIRLLYKNGLYLEMASLQRLLDETHEDMDFLALGCIHETTELHERYLSSFWDEEIDDSGIVGSSSRKKLRIQRKEIQAYLADFQNSDELKQLAQHTMKTLYSTYSGYIHGASVFIMDMYYGSPPRFHTNGMDETGRNNANARTLFNYACRSFDSLMIVALAFNIMGYSEIDVESLIQQSNQHHEFIQQNK